MKNQYDYYYEVDDQIIEMYSYIMMDFMIAILYQFSLIFYVYFYTWLYYKIYLLEIKWHINKLSIILISLEAFK